MRLEETSIGPFPVLTLTDTGTGAAISALPTCGGATHRLVLPDPDGRLREVMVPMRGQAEVRRQRWSKGSLLAPWPNRIRQGRYSFEGKEYAVPMNFKWQGGHAIHGKVAFETFRLAKRSADAPCFELVLDSKGWEGYPFATRTTFRYALEAGGFVLGMSLENRSRRRIPAGLGWHPYFRLSGSVKPCLLQVPSGRKLSMDEFAVPDGKRLSLGRLGKPEPVGEDFLDACLELGGRPGTATTRLADPKLGLALEVWQETGPGKFGYLQVFTHPARHCLAIEPMTCAPDAFNNGIGLEILEPGQSLAATCGVRLARA